MKLRDFEKLVSLYEKASPTGPERAAQLSDPVPFLQFINRALDKRIQVDDFGVLQPWAIAAIAALGTTSLGRRVFVQNAHSTPPAQFAGALGLDDLLSGDRVHGLAEKGRTVKLVNVSRYEEIEPVSMEISELVFSDQPGTNSSDYIDVEEVKKTIRYVMIELLRNVIQHSNYPQGAIILAQRMDKYEQPFIQIAVADCGIGIFDSLRVTHVDIETPAVALERSIWPYFSGKFHQGEKGAAQNAGLGLFFVSEMAKLSGGRLLISSRGASLLIQGDPNALGINKIQEFGEGFEGTLVAFELPKRGVADYDALIAKITQLARGRAARREETRWLRFDIPPKDSLEYIISIASENTVIAEEFSRKELLPRILNRQVLVLNFCNMKICTQSYLHAILFEAVRVSHALQVPLFIKQTSPSVRDGIHLVEMYAL